MQRMAIVATTVLVVFCCFIIVVKKRDSRIFEAQQQEQLRQAEYEDNLKRRQEIDARQTKENRVQELEYLQQHESSVTLLENKEEELYQPQYSWDELETMVRNLTNEDYYASVWCAEINSPKWVVIYSKDGKTYFRHFNPEKKTYGNKIRLIKDEIGKFHASGNKRDRYYYGNRGVLIHEVNGVEKERFFNHRTIDLFTPEPMQDGYDDWEDYYYDNEEDFRDYYGQ